MRAEDAEDLLSCPECRHASEEIWRMQRELDRRDIVIADLLEQLKRQERPARNG